MATWRVNSGASAEWIPNTAYSLGARVVCRSAYATVARRKYTWECTTAGTSHATTEPTWPDGPAGQTIADGATLVWTCRLCNDGDWANATCYLAYILSATSPVAAGDSVYIHNAHSESKNWGGTSFLYGSATKTNPILIFCVDKDNADALSIGAILYTIGAYNLYFYNWAYSYGVQYKSSANIRIGSVTSAGGWVVEANGAFMVFIGTGLPIGFTGGGPASLDVINADIQITAFDGAIGNFSGGGGRFSWKKGKFYAATGTVRNAAAVGNGSMIMVFEDIDFSELDSYSGGCSLVNNIVDQGAYDVLFSRCKFPDGNPYAFDIIEGTEVKLWGGRIRVHHCSVGNRYYDFLERTSDGQIENENTIVRTGGANDGTIGQAWKMTSSALTKDSLWGLVSPPIHIWGDYAAEKTFTVEGIWDSETNIQDDEIWMELEYPADNTSGLGEVSRVKCAPLGTPADITASTVAWTTTGLTNPNKFKFAVTVTPGKKGPVTAKIVLAKPSTTVYIDPLITVS